MPLDGNSTQRMLTDVTAAFRSVLEQPDLDLTLASSLEDVPNWDSVDLIAVIVELECRYDILFELPQIDNFTLVGDIVRAVAAKCRLQAA
jgi:acyl carrier protein